MVELSLSGGNLLNCIIDGIYKVRLIYSAVGYKIGQSTVVDKLGVIKTCVSNESEVKIRKAK